MFSVWSDLGMCEAFLFFASHSHKSVFFALFLNIPGHLPCPPFPWACLHHAANTLSHSRHKNVQELQRVGQKYNNSCDENAGQKADILVPNLLLISSIFGSYSCRRHTDRQTKWPAESFYGQDKHIDTHPYNMLISLQRVHCSLDTVQVRRNILYLTCQHAQLLKHLKLKFCLVCGLQIENRKYTYQKQIISCDAFETWNAKWSLLWYSQ